MKLWTNIPNSEAKTVKFKLAISLCWQIDSSACDVEARSPKSYDGIHVISKDICRNQVFHWAVQHCLQRVSAEVIFWCFSSAHDQGEHECSNGCIAKNGNCQWEEIPICMTYRFPSLYAQAHTRTCEFISRLRERVVLKISHPVYLLLVFNSFNRWSEKHVAIFDCCISCLSFQLFWLTQPTGFTKSTIIENIECNWTLISIKFSNCHRTRVVFRTRYLSIQIIFSKTFASSTCWCSLNNFWYL